MAKSSNFPELAAIIDLQGIVHAREAELTQAVQLNHLSGLGNPPRGLLGKVQISPGATAAIESITLQIRSHVVFRWLQSSAGFERARRALTRKMTDDPEGMVAIAQIGFLRDVLAWLSITVSATKSGWRPKRASSRQKRDIVKHAQALLVELERISSTEVTELDALRRLLSSLCVELGNTKRSYSGPLALERNILEGLSASMVATGLPNARVVEIVECIAEVYGFATSHRSVQRYVTTARNRQLQFMGRYLAALTTGSKRIYFES